MELSPIKSMSVYIHEIPYRAPRGDRFFTRRVEHRKSLRPVFTWQRSDNKYTVKLASCCDLSPPGSEATTNTIKLSNWQGNGKCAHSHHRASSEIINQQLRHGTTPNQKHVGLHTRNSISCKFCVDKLCEDKVCVSKLCDDSGVWTSCV